MKFQDDISNMNTYIRTYIHTYIHTYGQAETNMPPHFFKVGGIKTGQMPRLIKVFARHTNHCWVCHTLVQIYAARFDKIFRDYL